MTHTVHPYAHRIGILRGWKSHWFSQKDQYREYFKADTIIRKFLEEETRTYHVSSIEMERGEGKLNVIIRTSRPGLVIGRNGENATALKAGIEKLIRKQGLEEPHSITIDVQEVRSPESDAAIVAQMVRSGLERRFPYRRTLKQTVDKVMANRNVKGVRIALAGRLGGAEMSRQEELKKGPIPLQTFRADVDFAREMARLPYGAIGVKVWIYRGEIFADGKKQL
ncbi:MAG: 30S ribosomal protein S3 [Candidatus Paceibacterota bacterium]